MTNKTDPYALTGDPLTAVKQIFGTLPRERWLEAIAIALVAEGPDAVTRLRTAVFQVSQERPS